MVHRSRRHLGAVVAIGSLLAGFAWLAPQAALSAESARFDAQAFRAAQAAGKPVLVDVYADW